MKNTTIGFFKFKEGALTTIEKLKAQKLEGDNTTYFIEEIKTGDSINYAVKANINYSPELQKELNQLFKK